MRDLVKASEGLKTVGVITGGIDSRTVLAHLIALEKDIDLAISGREQNIDVRIAKNIAEKLSKQILISDELVDNNINWLKKLAIRNDGVYGILSRYRLHKKNLMLETMGVGLS